MKDNNRIIVVEDFFNKVAKTIQLSYFPDVKYYRDNKQNENCQYSIECFSNGVLDYNKFITILSRNCNDTKDNLHELVSKFVVSFNDFKFKK